MTLGPSKSVSRAKDGKIYGWSGSYGLTSSAVTLLDYTNPSAFYLTRVTLGIDWSGISAGEVLSYTINVDNQALFVEKLVVASANIGQQPKMYEFIIPPNSTVKVQATESANNGAISCILTGYRV
mgnify:FL=1|jgi:hypothetical protein